MSWGHHGDPMGPHGDPMGPMGSTWGPHVDPWGSIRGVGGEDPHGAVALRTLPLRVPCGPRGDPMGNIVPCDLLYSLEFYRNGKCALRGKSTWRANHQRKYRRIQLGVMRLKGERATNRFYKCMSQTSTTTRISTFNSIHNCFLPLCFRIFVATDNFDVELYFE